MKQPTQVDFRPLLFLIKLLYGLCIVAFLYLLFGDALQGSLTPAPILDKTQARAPVVGMEQDDDKVVDGIHLATGLVYAEGFTLVRANCTACHSAKLITQNRATQQGWTEMIRWMQATQGLWDLGENEKPIVDYLAAHYAPEEVGRRANLEVAEIEWYLLELD